MTQTFEEMCKTRDPLYAALKPFGAFKDALRWDANAEAQKTWYAWEHAERAEARRDKWLLWLTIRALRNQGQPYYDAR